MNETENSVPIIPGIATPVQHTGISHGGTEPIVTGTEEAPRDLSLTTTGGCDPVNGSEDNRHDNLPQTHLHMQNVSITPGTPEENSSTVDPTAHPITVSESPPRPVVPTPIVPAPDPDERGTTSSPVKSESPTFNIPALTRFKTPQQVAEQTLGEITWMDDEIGYLECPGVSKHSTRDSWRDCRVNVDGTPTIYCLHSGCADDIKQANDQLRAAFDAELVMRPPANPARVYQGKARLERADALEEAARNALPIILRDHVWTLEEISSSSPSPVPADLADQSVSYLRLYPEDSRIWLGETTSTGIRAHAANFQPPELWRRMQQHWQPYICTSSFREGVFSRSAENVERRLFLVYEADRIDPVVDAKLKAGEPLTEDDKRRSKEQGAAVIRYLRDHFGLHLRAVVDAGNKSLHGHFDYPGDDIFRELQIVLPALMCDPAVLRPTQPVRLPGHEKNDRVQRLLYLDLSTASQNPVLPSSILLPKATYPASNLESRDVESSRAEGNSLNSLKSFTVSDGGFSAPDQSGSSSNSYTRSAIPPVGPVESAPSSLNSFTTGESWVSGAKNPGGGSSNSLPVMPASPAVHQGSSSNSSPSEPAPVAVQQGSSSNSLPAPAGRSARNMPAPLLPAAFHGIAGEIVRMIEPHSEADPAALLIQLLAGFGNIIGRGAFISADGARHHMNLFTTLVGESSKGRKGTSWSQIARLLERVASEWKKERNTTGLSSGEGLIWAVRDAIMEQKPAKGPGALPGDVEMVVKDPGIKDKRLFVVEEEFANTLKVMGREANTLSPVIRQAWNGADLNTLVKNNPAKSTEPHITIVGHITSDELLKTLNATEAANGFANRFLWVATRRSKYLPEGGDIDGVNFNDIVVRLQSAIQFAQGAGEVKRADETRVLWREIYKQLSDGKPGMFGAVTGRAEAQVMRLSAIYALLDESNLIHPVHHHAAMALWRYCEDTARWVFGYTTRDKNADKIHTALQNAGMVGMTKTDISDNVFKRNISAHDIHEALKILVEFGYAEPRHDGANIERWFITHEVRI